MDLHMILVLIFLIAVAAIVFWFLARVPIPEPFNYIVYAVIAIVAIIVLGNLLGVWGGGGLHLGQLSQSLVTVT
jgi:predicted membrane channel-forming protein YqfA (hemolysin III family)